jgi:hypothetical protein
MRSFPSSFSLRIPGRAWQVELSVRGFPRLGNFETDRCKPSIHLNSPGACTGHDGLFYLRGREFVLALRSGTSLAHSALWEETSFRDVCDGLRVMGRQATNGSSIKSRLLLSE